MISTKYIFENQQFFQQFPQTQNINNNENDLGYSTIMRKKLLNKRRLMNIGSGLLLSGARSVPEVMAYGIGGLSGITALRKFTNTNTIK